MENIISVKMGKFECPVCHKSANKIASNKTGSVQCAVCSLWYHPPCANVDEGKLDMIYKCVEMGMNSPWSCTVCETGLAKVAKDVKENRARIGNVEASVETMVTKQDQLAEKNISQDRRMDLQDKLLKELQDQLLKAQGGSGEKVLEEIAERGSRERNVICHKCPESPASIPEDARVDDMAGTQGLFDHLGLAMRAEHVLIGVKRLGKIREDGQARPLLLIFRNKQDRDKLLEKSPRLSKANEEYWREINIVADLTQRQRELEQNMFKRAEAQNLARNNDEQSKNLCWKVIGRRGERVLRQVELRHEEMVNTEGKVVLKSQEGSPGQRQRQWAEKRPRSPGSTPPARGGQRSSRFGVRE